MRGKILFTLGLGIGYVFGTRAGRARYNEIKSAALKVWNDPRVQEQVTVATEFVKEKAPEVVDFVSANAMRFAPAAPSQARQQRRDAQRNLQQDRHRRQRRSPSPRSRPRRQRQHAPVEHRPNNACQTNPIVEVSSDFSLTFRAN